MQRLCGIYDNMPMDVRNGYRPYRVHDKLHVSGGYSDYWLTDMGDAYTLDGELLGCQIYIGDRLRISYASVPKQITAIEVYGSHVNVWSNDDGAFYATNRLLHHGHVKILDNEYIIRAMEKFKGDSPF